MLERRKYREFYNCVIITALGYSSGALIVIRPAVNNGLEESTHIGLELGGAYVASLGISDGV